MGQTPVVTFRTPLRALLAVGVLAVAGCGGQDDGDPAALLPVSSPVAAEIVLAPEGDVRADLDAAASKVLGTDDPQAALAKLAGPAFERTDLDFKRDVEPWLGDRAAMALTGFGSGERKQGFVAVATTDEKAALAAARKGRTVTTRNHRDVEFGVDERRVATAIVEGALVAGSERGVKAAIDVAAGETDKLIESGRFEQAKEDVGTDGSLGFAYVDLARVLKAATAEASAANPQAGLLFGAAGTAGLQTLGMVFEADGKALRLRGALRSDKPLPRGEGDASAALKGAPADSIAAVGIADVGGTVTKALEGFGGLLGVGLEAALEQVKRDSGLDLRQDLLAWMGDATLFVRGTSVADADGALVVQSRDAAASRAALPKLAALVGSAVAPMEKVAVAGADAAYALTGAGPGEIVLAAGGDRVVVAYGRPAAVEALRPGGATLATAPGFRAAAGLLGDDVEPALYVDLPAVARLAGGAKGEAGEVLARLGAIVAGGSADGEVSRFEGLVALK